MFKAFSQIKVANGSSTAAALDLIQRRIPFEQNDGKDLDWPSLHKALSPDNGPGVVSIKDLQNRRQSPVYLREEIVRRLGAAAGSAGKTGEAPLHVFVLIGSPMDLYVFPSLPAVETGNEQDCIIYYLQFEFLENEQTRSRHKVFEHFEREGYSGNVGNVEKMLKPLKIRTFQVNSPDDVRHALAKIMEELSRT
jgi:hypothetical protein